MLTIHPEHSSMHSPPPVSESLSPPTALCTKPKYLPPRTRPSLYPPSRPPRPSPRTARTGAARHPDTAKEGRTRGRRCGAIGRCCCCSGYAWGLMA
jgi:hypothetical protein